MASASFFSFPALGLTTERTAHISWQYLGEILLLHWAFERLQTTATASAMALALFSCFCHNFCFHILSRPKTANAHRGAESKLYIIGTGGRVTHAGLFRYSRPETRIQLLFFCFSLYLHSSSKSMLQITTSCSMSFTLGTLVSCKPQNAATFSIHCWIVSTSS